MHVLSTEPMGMNMGAFWSIMISDVMINWCIGKLPICANIGSIDVFCESEGTLRPLHFLRLSQVTHQPRLEPQRASLAVYPLIGVHMSL